MLRRAFVSKSVLISVLISGYVAALGILSLSFGYIAGGLSARVIDKTKTSEFAAARKVSRVEQWLKAQTVSFEKPVLATPTSSSVEVSEADSAAVENPVRYAATLATAMDQSETYGANTDVVEFAAAEPITWATNEVLMVAAVLATPELTDLQATHTLPANAVAEPGAPSRNSGPVHQRISGKATVSKKIVRIAAAQKAKRSAVAQFKLAAIKAAGASRAKAFVVAADPSPQPPAVGGIRRVRFAETPAEIIRRSLLGAS